MAMETQAMEQLTLIAAGKADYADEKMNKQQTYTYMVADYLQQLYTDPDSYTPREANGPDPALDGELSPQLLYFNETIDPAAVAEEVALTANTGDMLLSIARPGHRVRLLRRRQRLLPDGGRRARPQEGVSGLPHPGMVSAGYEGRGSHLDRRF